MQLFLDNLCISFNGGGNVVCREGSVIYESRNNSSSKLGCVVCDIWLAIVHTLSYQLQEYLYRSKYQELIDTNMTGSRVSSLVHSFLIVLLNNSITVSLIR